MKVLFFGSSFFSIPILEALYKNHQVVSVISTPDEKQGRGQKVQPSVVKQWAEEKGLKVLTPENLKEESLTQQLKALEIDFSVIASYGKLVPQCILDLPQIENLNVHPSLLPKYRGASPIQSSLLNKDEVTGVSLMRPVLKMDAGDVLMQKSTPVTLDVNAEELSESLAEIGAELTQVAIDALSKQGKVEFKTQDEALATYTSKIEKKDAEFNWSMDALEIHNKVRAYIQWPVAYTLYQNDRLRLLDTSLQLGEGSETPGTLIEVKKNEGFLIQTGRDRLWVKSVQLSGKSAISGDAFLNGRRLKVGDSL